MISTLYGKIFDKLPKSGKVIFIAIAVVGGVYSIRQYGLADFLLRVIFSP
jgi:hypothetical protein